MNLFQLASRGIDLDALPDESAPEREPLAFEPAPAGSRFAVPQEFDAAFQAAGDEYGVDPDVLRAMAFAESRFRPDVISGQVKSRTGAAGLMQFMPGTAERFGINPLDPVESIFGAAAYMRANLEKFGGDYGKAVAAYNWGENRKAYDAEDWQSLAPKETQGYLKTVFAAADELKLRAPAPMPPVELPPKNAAAPEAAKAQPGATPERTWGEAFGDTTKSLAQGLLDVGSLPGVAYSAVTGDWDTGYLKAIRGTQDVLQDQKSSEIQARGKALQDKLSTAEGWREKLAVGGIETLKDPTLLFDTLARSAPGMFAGGVVGRGAGAAANAVGNAAFAKALGTGSELAARVAVTAKNGAGVLARATATGTAAGIQGASVASETYEELSKLPVEAFKSEPEWKDLEAQHGAQQAKEILAGAAANRALLMATGASVLSMKLVPGGDAIEKMFLPPSLKGAAAKAAVASTSLLTRPMGKGMEGGLVSKAVELIVKGSQAGALESVSEGVEEGTGAIAKGLELSRAGQRVNLSEMAGEAYGQGAAAGLVMGKVAGMQEAYGSRAPRVEDQPTTPQAPIVPSAPVAPQSPQSAQTDVAAQILQAEAAQPQATGLAVELEALRARSAPDFTQRSTTPQAQPGSVPVTGGLAAELQALRARSSPQEAANAPQRTPSDTQQQTKATSAQAADVAGVNAPVPAADLSGAGVAATQAAGVGAAPVIDPATRQPATSWVLRDKSTGAVVMETSQKSVADKINTAKYEAVPIGQHLASLSSPPTAQGVPANVPQPAQPGTQASQTPSAQGAAQAAGQPIAASVRLGREQTPLSEGGKPFKTRKAAGDAKKLQPMMRVVPVEGGYALAEKTPAQLAAEAKAARRLSQPKTGTAGAPLAAHEFIAAEGGLSAIAASDLGIDNNPRVGNRRLFAGRGRGLSMEQATQKLIADGYLGEGATLNDAYALIKTSISRPQYTADGIERIAQAEANAQFDDYLAAQEESASDGDPWSDTQPVALDDFSDDMLESSGYDAAPDAIKAEVRALLEMANALGIDAESIMLDAHEQTINATEQDYYAAAKSALETAITRSNGDRRTPAGSEGQSQSGAATGPAAQGLNQPVALDQQAQAATENVAPEPLELASQTPAEAAALQESQEQAAKAEAAAKRAADVQASKDEDRKRIAQASVRAADEFELGQDPLDSLTGQGGMFDAPARQQEAQLPASGKVIAREMVKSDMTKRQEATPYARYASGEYIVTVEDFGGDRIGAQLYSVIRSRGTTSIERAPTEMLEHVAFDKINQKAIALYNATMADRGQGGLMFSRKAKPNKDAEYLAAVERGDMATAQRLVNEAAAEAGYVGSDYRMQHEAPSAENDGVRLDELRDNGLVPDDYWTHPQWYVSTPEEAAAHRAVVAAMRSADARKAAGKSPGSVAMVVYRAIPKTVKDGAIRNGDWVTPSLEYAKLEGESIPGGYRIISLPASAKNLYWDGNSVAEFGYDDGQSYGYKNTKNNRKLLDAVTHDDDGAVIPLSQRFNARNGDVRFSRAQPAISSAAAAMEEASRRADALYDAEPGTVTPEEFSAVGDARRAAEAAMLDALAQLPDSGFAVEARTSDGRMLIVTPSASEQGRWQLTRFGKDGEPWGDTRFDTKRQALQYLVDEAVPSSIKPAGAAMSRTVQPMRTPAAAIRAAITKAYGKLLGQLEAKGLVTLTQTQEQAIEAAARARADKTGGDAEAIRQSLLSATQSDTADSLDIKRSADGAIEGFFDPQTGQSFLIADNLTAESAPGTLMHEVGIHMAADSKLQPLFERAAQLLSADRGNAFIQRVQARMDRSGETSGEEAAAYIVTEYENDRANSPPSVAKWVQDFTAAVRAWLFGKGVLLKADQLTVADIAAVARANARSMARGAGWLNYAQAELEKVNERIPVFKFLEIDPATGDVYSRGGTVLEPEGQRLGDGAPVDGRIGANESGGIGAGNLAELEMRLAAGKKNPRRFDGREQDVVGTPARDADAVGNGAAIQGNRLSDSELARYLASTRGGFEAHGVGVSTLKRALITRDHAGTDVPGLLYSKAGNNPPPIPTNAQAGLFAPSNPWELPQATRTDKLIYELQDGRIDLKRVQEAIAATGKQITEGFDARLAETLMPGRIARRTESFLSAEVKPLLESMAKNNVSQDELSDYLLARHAPERNAQIAKVNDEMPDGGAGTNSQGVLMTTQAARDHIAALTQGKRLVLELLAKRVDDLTLGTREVLVREGLEKQETVDAWTGAYKHYVPLFKDEAMETPGHPIGAGVSVTGTASKRATGSTGEVTNMLAHILMQREAAITRAEKNRVAMSLYGLALTNPNAEMWTTIRPSMPSDQIANELVRMGVDPMEAEVGMQGVPTIRGVEPVSGKVVDRPNPMYKRLDNSLVVKVNGEDRVILFNASNERAVRLVRNLKNQDGVLGQLDLAGSIVGKATRYFASINTQYNPAFGMVNIVRDVGGAMVNLTDTALAGKQARVLSDSIPAMIGIARDLRGDAQRTPWSDLWQQFQDDGGRTGYRDLFIDPYKRADAVQSELDKLGKDGKLTPGAAAHAVLDLLDDFNTTLENGVRLSAYKAALDKGMSRAESARMARELTLDFNRKGRAGREMGPLFAFFNASVQGTARTLKALQGPAGKRILIGGLSLGVIQALLLSMAGYEDDEIPEFVKARAFIIPLAGKQYITIPLQFGLNALPNTGRVVTELLMSGGKDWGEKSFNALGELAGSFNPLGGGNIFTGAGALKTISPTVIDPIVDMATNTDFTGKPIGKERMPWDTRPGFTMGREGTQRSFTGQAYIGISKAINSLTGGNDFAQGLASPSPEEVRYVFTTVGGGVFRELEKILNASVLTAQGEGLKAREVPLGSRFAGEVEDQDLQRSRFFKNSSKIEKLEAQLKGLSKEGRGDEVRKLIDDNPLVKLYELNDEVRSNVTKLNKLASESINDKEALKRIDAARTTYMRALNDKVMEMEKSAN
jgi:hypothetical protein